MHHCVPLLLSIDGQVRLVRLQTDNFHLPFETAAYIYIYKYRHIYIYKYRYIYNYIHIYIDIDIDIYINIYAEKGTNKIRQLHLFAANAKRKRQTSIRFLKTENGSLFSLVVKR